MLVRPVAFPQDQQAASTPVISSPVHIEVRVYLSVDQHAYMLMGLFRSRCPIVSRPMTKGAARSSVDFGSGVFILQEQAG